MGGGGGGLILLRLTQSLPHTPFCSGTEKQQGGVGGGVQTNKRNAPAKMPTRGASQPVAAEPKNNQVP